MHSKTGSGSLEIIPIDDLHSLTRESKSKNSSQSAFESVEIFQPLWTRLLLTVHHSAVSDKHLTATCNAVCFVIRALAHASDGELQAHAFSRTVWTDCFGAARSAFASGKNKPALQILDLLAYLAKSNPDKAAVSDNISGAAGEMVRILYTQRPKKPLKDACIILCFFSKKLSDCFSLSEVLKLAYVDSRSSFLRLCHVTKISVEGLDLRPDAYWMSFILSLLMILPVAEAKSAALKFLSVLCSINPRDAPDLIGLVQEAIVIYGNADETFLGDLTRDVLPSIIQTKEKFYAILPVSRPDLDWNASQVNLVLTQLNFGKAKSYILDNELPGLLNEWSSKSGKYHTSHVQSKYATLQCLMLNLNSETRQHTCELLLSSTSSRAAIPPLALTCFMNSLPAIHDDNSAYHRGELYSIFRRFLARVNQHEIYLLSSKSDDRDANLTTVSEFWTKYTFFLRAELAPSVSYGRHVLALDLLCFMLRTFVSEKSSTLSRVLKHPDVFKVLVRLILDPYDDIRSGAMEALFCLAGAARTTWEGVVAELQPVQVIRELAATTNRADHADALGRIMSLSWLFDSAVEQSLPSSAESPELTPPLISASKLYEYLRSLRVYTPSDGYPLHGLILGLSYTLSRMKPNCSNDVASKYQDLLLSISWRIWVLAQHHLCVDSPEIEAQSDHESPDFGPKDLLAYTWRALRDSNVLMQALLESAPVDDSLLKSVGDLCFEQLSLLRHRGAFSTVAQTFLICCQKARSSKVDGAYTLTEDWFRRALVELESQADKLTRRSAGLPAMCAALLDAQEQSKFNASFDVLVKIADQGIEPPSDPHSQDRLRLPQVHALNCIKDVMMNSRFRSNTQPLVMRTINLAAKCMGSNVWAIKNCGLMLLRASITRLDADTGLGASEAGVRTQNTILNDMSPVDIATLLLEGPQNRASTSLDKKPDRMATQAESEFAGLDLLGRLFIEDREQSRIEDLIEQKLGHELWHIRAQAARLMSKCTQENGELPLIDRFSKSLCQSSSVNTKHGYLMAMDCLLNRAAQNLVVTEYGPFVMNVLLRLADFGNLQDNAMLLSAWVGTSNRLIELTRDLSMVSKLSPRFVKMDQHVSKGAGPDSLLQRARTLFFLQTCSSNEAGSIEQTAVALRRDPDATVHAITHSNSEGMNSDVLKLLVGLVSDTREDDVRLTAMVAIAEAIGKSSKTLLSHGDVEVILKATNFLVLNARENILGQLLVYAYLCTYIWRQEYHDLLGALRNLADGFLLGLRVAVSDVYEEPTRRAAVEVFMAWKDLHNLPNILLSIFGEIGKFEIMSILYDLLNDDDEDIRQDACIVTAHVCGGFNISAGIFDTHNAFASRQQLRSQLADNPNVSDLLYVECIRRVLGLVLTTRRQGLRSALVNNLQMVTVQERLAVVYASSKELFAEEKQNLYIDDVAEIEHWSRIATHIQPAIPILGLETWAETGVEALNTYFRALLQRGNRSLDPAVELLTVRVVAIARLAGFSDGRLASLRDNAQQLAMPESITASFSWLLR